MTPRRRRRAVGEDQDPVPLADALARVGVEWGLPTPTVLARITERWDELVGPAVATHARLRSLRDGILTIAVDSAPWATELRFLGDALASRANELVGVDVVEEVRVVVAP